MEENDNDDDDDDEEEEDEIMNQRGSRDAGSSRRRGQETATEEEDEDDDDGENEFQGHEYDDDDGEEDEDDDDEEEDAKTSDVSGIANPSSQKKRQRSNTPPPLTHAASSFDIKTQLTTSLLYLNGTDLGHVMSLLEQHCPNVLETNDTNIELQLPESMEMNVDLLMDEYYNVFTMIQNYCNDHMVKKRYAASAQGGNVVKIKDISNKRKERKT